MGWSRHSTRARARTKHARAQAVLAVALVAIALAACTSVVPVPLRTLTHDTGACRGVGLVGAVLDGDLADEHVAWVKLSDGTRRNVVWPPGYSARFNPNVEILDPRGVVVLRAGDAIDGACVITGGDADRGALLVRPDVGRNGGASGQPEPDAGSGQAP